MKSCRRRAGLAGVAFMAVSGAIVLMISAAPAANAQGGNVNVDGWCQNWRVPPRDYAHAFALDAHNAFSWVCADYTAQRDYDVDMNAACAYTYGGNGSAHLRDANNAYSWYCS
jgi:hypothetical protein